MIRQTQESVVGRGRTTRVERGGTRQGIVG